MIINDIVYDEKHDLKMKIYLPDDSRDFDVFVYFHGGGLENGSRGAADLFAEDLTNKNIAVVSVDYRLYNDAKFPDFLVDSANSIAWVKANMQKYGSVRRMFVGGSSAGGYISMMLCFDKRYLLDAGVCPDDIAGYIHDAGQPTSHFNVLREKGIDTRRIIVDETAPLYFIGMEKEYPPMMIVVSDNDMENRYEQTELVMSTLRHFRYDMSKVTYKVMNSTHCGYLNKKDENGNNLFADLVLEFIQ